MSTALAKMPNSWAMEEVNSLLSSNSIDELALFITDELPVIELELKHTFADGVYMREMFVPAGVLMVGKVHLTADPFVLMSGSMNVFTAEGGMVTISAPLVGITATGVTKVGYVLEDSHWINYHALSAVERKALDEGLDEDELVDIIESRILEDLEPVRDGKTLYELYQSKLKEGLLCPQ